MIAFYWIDANLNKPLEHIEPFEPLKRYKYHEQQAYRRPGFLLQ